MKTIKLAPGERLVTNQLNRKGVLPQNIVDAARDIVANVRANGDAAVRDYCQRFDGVELQSFRLPQEQIDAALADIHSSGLREVPSYLRDRHRPGSDEYGVYKYPHDYPEGWVDQRYLPEGLERGAFWQPAGRGWEEWRVEQSERDRSGNAPK